MVTSFRWKRSERSQSPESWSSGNVRWKKGKGGMVGYKGMVMKEEGMLFIWNLGEAHESRYWGLWGSGGSSKGAFFGASFSVSY